MICGFVAALQLTVVLIISYREPMAAIIILFGNYESSTGFFTAISIASVVCGVIVMFAALALRMHPE